jgi:hypothetical protein
MKVFKGMTKQLGEMQEGLNAVPELKALLKELVIELNKQSSYLKDIREVLLKEKYGFSDEDLEIKEDEEQ